MMLRLIVTVLLVEVSLAILVKNEDGVLTISYPAEQSTVTQSSQPDPFQTVRAFLRHYNSLRPIAVLVDDTEDSCNDASVFVGRIFEAASKASRIKFLIYKFNETGVMPLDEAYGNETERIDGMLTYKKPEEQPFLGIQKTNGTLAFFAILNAATSLPKSSAILLFIGRKIQDEDLASHVAILRDKDIKVYVVWGENPDLKTNEERLLREVCSYTGGMFLYNTWKPRNKSNYRKYLENHKKNLNTSIVFTMQQLKGRAEFEFPIDGDVMGIHLRLAPPNVKGTLTTPKGVKIELDDENSITSYGGVSFSVASEALREIYLDATTTTSASENGVVGQWRASLRTDKDEPYQVIVYVDAPLTANATVVRNTKGPTAAKINLIKLGLTGNVGYVNEVSFLDKSGKETLQKTLNQAPNKQPLTTGSWYPAQTNAYNEFDVEVENITLPHSIVIHGKDHRGNNFSRITYLEQSRIGSTNLKPSLLIDVAEGSELRPDGGTKPIIMFDVTNTMNEALRVKFYCQDTKSLLFDMDPQSRLMSPLETVKVKLTLTAIYGTYQEEITFFADTGTEYVKKRVLVDVGMTHSNDAEQPSLDYSFPSDCSQVALSSCEGGTWTVEVTARDTGSGLLQVSSYPRGIYFPEEFITGTKDAVKGIYSESCCNPDLKITAIDIANNRNVITINAYRSTWNAAQISALVLGILFLIVIIAVAVFLCFRCRKKEAFELPRYRGGNDI